MSIIVLPMFKFKLGQCCCFGQRIPAISIPFPVLFTQNSFIDVDSYSCESRWKELLLFVLTRSTEGCIHNGMAGGQFLLSSTLWNIPLLQSRRHPHSATIHLAAICCWLLCLFFSDFDWLALVSPKFQLVGLIRVFDFNNARWSVGGGWRRFGLATRNETITAIRLIE